MTTEFNVLDKTIAHMRLSQVLKHVPDNSDVPDFGCGNQAFLLRSITKRISYGKGIDFGIKKDHPFENIFLEPMTANYAGLIKDYHKYDVVIMLAVIEHVPLKDVVRLLKLLKSKLKKNGKIVMTTPTTRGQFVLELLAFKLHIISEKQILDHKKYYNKEDFVTLTKSIGMKLESYSTFQIGMNSIIVLSNK